MTLEEALSSLDDGGHLDLCPLFPGISKDQLKATVSYREGSKVEVELSFMGVFVDRFFINITKGG